MRLADFEGEVPGAALSAAGYAGGWGYSSRHLSKCPGVHYGAGLVNQGLLYGIVFEDTAERARAGYDAGKADAEWANTQADLQGYPISCIIVWTADFPARWGDVSEYARGFHDGSKRPVGVYADGEVVRAAKAAGWVVFGWFTCSDGFPGSRDKTGRDMQQFCSGESGLVPVPGHDVDTNEVENPDALHAWGQSTGPVVDPEEAELMAIKDDLLNAMNAQELRLTDKINSLAVKPAVVRDAASEHVYVVSGQGKLWVNKDELMFLVLIGAAARWPNFEKGTETIPRVDPKYLAELPEVERPGGQLVPATPAS